jgi:uracil-DNA glycosylase family 4
MVSPVKAMDENTRRYYLDVMGIQCWESLEAKQLLDESHHKKHVMLSGDDQADADRDVASTGLLPDISNWQQLETAVQQCKQCPLHKTRKQPILGRGHQSAELMIVLLSPDASDDASGQLCSGETYELLSKMLGAIDVAIDEVYLTSLFKCAVPVSHMVSANELRQCNTYLQQQIRLIAPKQLVVLGETAARCLLQKDRPLDDLRVLINSAENNNVSMLAEYPLVPLLISYSPQELLQQPENKRKAWQDLQQLKKMMRGG